MKSAKRQKILIVEDEDLITQMLKEYFELVEPHLELEVAKTIKEARQKLSSEEWALCICDCRLPDGSACDLFIEKLFPCPVIVTTGYISPKELDHTKNIGANLAAVMKKPYFPVDLHQKIKEILKI